MTGWSVEIAPDERWYADAWRSDGKVPAYHRARVEEFTREDCWFRVGDSWNGLGFGDADYPWSARCDHSERVVRWIGPPSRGEEEPPA